MELQILITSFEEGVLPILNGKSSNCCYHAASRWAANSSEHRVVSPCGFHSPLHNVLAFLTQG